MAECILSESLIRQRSEDLQIPFVDLLPSAVTEYFLYQISKSTFAEKLYLRNGSSLGVENNRRKRVFSLSYYYQVVKDEHLTEMQLGQLMKEVLSRKPEYVYQIEKERAGSYQIEVLAKSKEHEVPITLRFQELRNEQMQPAHGELPFFLQENTVIQFLQYPYEQVVAENFVEILEKMELINDLSCYEEIYGILKKEALDGRKVEQQIIEVGTKRELAFGKDRLDTVLHYKDYTYMKRKWAAYLKRERKKEPDWAEVMTLLEAFFPPVWRAIIKDEIFIGDWMPELCRFL